MVLFLRFLGQNGAGFDAYLKAYGNDLGVGGEYIAVLLYDDTITFSAKKGFMIIDEYLVNSRKNKIALQDIEDARLDDNGKVIVKLKRGQSSEFFSTLISDPKEPEWKGLNTYFSWLFHPLDMPKEVFKFLEEHYDGPKYEVQSSTPSATKQESQTPSPKDVYNIEGEYPIRVKQIMSISKMPSFSGGVYIGSKLNDDNVLEAINGYLNGFSITIPDVWFQIVKNGNGNQGLCISKTYIMNDLAQGFAIDQVQSVQLTDDGHVYVATKDGQAYYLLDDCQFDSNELELINQILAVVFYDKPAVLDLKQ